MVNRRDRKRHARRAIKLGKKLDRLEKQVALLRQEVSGVRAATKPAEFWTLALGMPAVALAIFIPLYASAGRAPSTDWVRGNLDLVGAIVVGVSVVIQAIVTTLDHWGVVKGRFRTSTSVLAIWTGLVGAALVVVAILMPDATESAVRGNL